MTDFVDLYLTLSETTSTNAKLDLLASYLSEIAEEDFAWSILILCGQRIPRICSSQELRQWTAQLTNHELWYVDECYQTVGDLAETIALLIHGKSKRTRFELAVRINQLTSLKGQPISERQEAVTRCWSEFNAEECLVFNKLLTGALRIGVSRGLVIKALSKVLSLSESQVAERLTGAHDPTLCSRSALLKSEIAGVDLRPYPFFLASPLEDKPDALGEPKRWIAEWKWDGIRAQVVYRSGKLAIWSRGEELMTDSFPEIAGQISALNRDCVLDGELIALTKGGEVAPFALLQKRLNRRRLTARLLEEIPVGIIAYDLLELDGCDLRGQPLIKRKELLHQLLLSSQIRTSALLEFNSWKDLEKLRETSRLNQSEGVMIKDTQSSYGVGRRRGAWWKWKVSPISCDAVLIYAQKGHGRRADLFTDYTFALWDGGRLVTFAKAYSGLTESEIREVDSYVKRNTLEKFGPVRSVKPELVFELGFDSLQLSKRHSSGIAVRFPRILRWRRDKPASEADTVERVRRLL